MHPPLSGAGLDEDDYFHIPALESHTHETVKPSCHAGLGGDLSHPDGEKSDAEKEEVPKVTPAESSSSEVELAIIQWGSDEIINYRKRVYGWWSKANDASKLAQTRKDNSEKARKAFAWFEDHGCVVTIKPKGKVGIKFPKAHE